MPNNLKVAVIGAGVAGLAAAWHLHNTGHQVTVYAGGEHIGGQCNTFLARTQKGEKVLVDTGFAVYHAPSSPNLAHLIQTLGVPVQEANASFGVSLNDGGFEYASTSRYAQRRNLLSPAAWQLSREIKRFAWQAREFLDQPSYITLSDFIAERSYSKAFAAKYLAPLGAIFWGMTPSETLAMPAASFARFIWDRGFFDSGDPLGWNSIKGGSGEYIKRLTAPFEHRIRRVAASRVRRSAAGVMVEAEGSFAEFDRAILACHADEAMNILVDMADDEVNALSSIRFRSHRAVLHQDDSLMPVRDAAWASWNVVSLAPELTEAAPSVSHWMNNLQDIEDDKPLFITTNPPIEPASELKAWEGVWSFPVLDQAAIAAQRQIPHLQGRGGVWFAGAWCGMGQHEDGVTSGLTVAEAITGIARPWQVREVSTAAFNVWPAQTQEQVAA